MKFLNLITGLFCLFAALTKLFSCLSYESEVQSVLNGFNESETISATVYSTSEFSFLLLWAALFTVLFLLWIWANVRQKTTFKIALSAITLLFALLMSITDNMDYSFYVNDTIIGGEIIEQ